MWGQPPKPALSEVEGAVRRALPGSLCHDQSAMTNMTDLPKTLSAILSDRYATNAARVRELAGPLTESQFWQRPFPFGNSFGHLVLHLTGNLNYYIGAQIANTGYVRDRPREFNDPNPPSKDEALDRFDDAIAMVQRTIREQSPEDWAREYSGAGTNAQTRLDMVMQCAAHIQHHIGQMIYLNYEWHQPAASPETNAEKANPEKTHAQK